MKLLIGVILLCSFAVAALGKKFNTRIVGGSDTHDGKYPYQVSLRNRGNFICGGSILNNRWILTAAHCVTGLRRNSISVGVGTNLLYGGDEQTYKSEYIVWHENYYNGDFGTFNDIALIRVNRNIKFNNKVQPIQLARKKCRKSNYEATLTGWGNLRYKGKTPNNLQEINLEVISQYRCARLLPYRITNSHICTFTRRGEGSCHGDSGGPLVADGMLIGIVSYGYKCAVGIPDVFTRVSAYVDWIDEITSYS